MRKVAFYLNNSGIESINCKNIKQGNPGLGGTPYLFFLLVYYLSLKDNLDIELLTTYKQCVDECVINKVVKDEFDAINYCKNNKIDIMVIRTTTDLNVYQYAKYKKMKLITWSHNFIADYRVLKEITSNDYVKRNVFVGKEQLEFYIDDYIYEKSTYIYNLVQYDIYNKNIVKNRNKENIVTYIGSLIETKGFHILAKNWSKIREKVPNAQLYVIGSGDLYDRNQKINNIIPTTEEYANRIIKYLGNDFNEIEKSIFFMGALGNSKNEILKKTKVGVSNPGGKSETFGLTAVEFQSSGIPVIAKRCCGYLDTISNKKTGYLFNNDKEMVEYIIKMLTNTELNEEMSKNAIKFIEKKFSIDNICTEWISLFNDVCNEQINKKLESINNKTFKMKWVKILFRDFRIKIKIKKFSLTKAMLFLRLKLRSIIYSYS